MRFVDQTTFGFPGGNCFSACVASLLDLDISEVPYWMGDTIEGDSDWWPKFNEWLEPRGYYALCFEIKSEWRPAGLHILSGKSPRELANPCALHSVIAKADRIVHDPHPSRDGLHSHDDVVILIPLDPAP